jgi:anti-sigma B factor antagonist
MTALELTTSEREGGAQIALSGELDIATAPRLEEEVRRLEGEGRKLIVVDLRGLQFMDSSGLRALLSADTRARERGARLVIVRGDERIQRVLRITRLDERLEIVDDAADAVAGAA